MVPLNRLEALEPCEAAGVLPFALLLAVAGCGQRLRERDGAHGEAWHDERRITVEGEAVSGVEAGHPFLQHVVLEE